MIFVKFTDRTESLSALISLDKVGVLELFVSIDMIGLLNFVRLTDTREFLSVSLFVDKVEGLRLYMFAFAVALVVFTDLEVLLTSLDAAALSAYAAPAESAKSSENRTIPETSIFFIYPHRILFFNYRFGHA